MYDIDPAKYEGYIYTPGDDLGGEGSLPGADAVYSLDNEGNDVSAILFTISDASFTGNVLYDPATEEAFPVFDELANRVNETPVFAAGRGYYIKVEDTTIEAGSDEEDALLLADVDQTTIDLINANQWQIVLFGEPIPSADCKVKIDDTRDLIGHFGGLTYYTPENQTLAESVYEDDLALPSTKVTPLEDGTAMVDDVAQNADNDDDDLAINVTNEDGSAVDVAVVSTFYNYVYGDVGDPSTLNDVYSWFGENADYSDLYTLFPGAAYWVKVDDAASDGPFFVNFFMPPEED
jgi:hypothetical protein